MTEWLSDTLLATSALLLLVLLVLLRKGDLLTLRHGS